MYFSYAVQCTTRLYTLHSANWTRPLIKLSYDIPLGIACLVCREEDLIIHCSVAVTAVLFIALHALYLEVWYHGIVIIHSAELPRHKRFIPPAAQTQDRTQEEPVSHRLLDPPNHCTTNRASSYEHPAAPTYHLTPPPCNTTPPSFWSQATLAHATRKRLLPSAVHDSSPYPTLPYVKQLHYCARRNRAPCIFCIGIGICIPSLTCSRAG
jgi:hypothetical protein